MIVSRRCEMSIIKDCEKMSIKLQNSIESFKQYLSIAKYNRNIWKNRYKTFEDFCRNEVGINNARRAFGVIKAKSIKMPEQVIISNLWKYRLSLNLYSYILLMLLKAVKESKLWPNPDKISFKEWIKSIKIDKAFKIMGDLLQGGKYAERSNVVSSSKAPGSKRIDKRTGKRIYREVTRNKKRNGA